MAMLRWLGLSGLVIVLDQFTKWIANTYLVLYQPVPVLPSLNLTLLYNPGAAFSFLAGAAGWQRWFFTVLTIAIGTGLLIWLTRLKPGQQLLAVSLALILGGAIGNLIDRVVYGYVIDFIDVYYQQWHWPAFNIADSAITVGATLMVIDSLRGPQRTEAEHD